MRRLVLTARMYIRSVLVSIVIIIALIFFEMKSLVKKTKLRTPVPTRFMKIVNARDLNFNLTASGHPTFDAVELRIITKNIPSDSIECVPGFLNNSQSEIPTQPLTKSSSALKYQICTKDLSTIFYGHLHSLTIAVNKSFDTVWMPLQSGLTETLFDVSYIRTKLLIKYGITLQLYEPNVGNVSHKGGIVLAEYTPPDGVFSIGCADEVELLSSAISNIHQIDKALALLINPSVMIRKVVDDISLKLGIFDMLIYNPGDNLKRQSYELAVNIQYPTRYRRPMFFASNGVPESEIKFENFYASAGRYFCSTPSMNPIVKDWLVLQMSRVSRRFFGNTKSLFAHLVSQVRLSSDTIDRGSTYLIKNSAAPAAIVECCTNNWCISDRCATFARKKLLENIRLLREYGKEKKLKKKLNI